MAGKLPARSCSATPTRGDAGVKPGGYKATRCRKQQSLEEETWQLK
jgi:hypothetical protein